MLTVYTIDVINSTNQVAVIDYGVVNKSWSPSNPDTILPNGSIKVCNIKVDIGIL